MDIFDCSQKGKMRKIFTFDEVPGGKFSFAYSNHFFFSLVTGVRNMTVNPRRSILGVIPVAGKISYHLFSIDTTAEKVAKLSRKSKWPSQYNSNPQSKFLLF